jgi:DNA-binding CsgD family transcriptional regulator
VKRHVLLYGLVGGVLIVVLKAVEFRFLVMEHSVEIYGALIAAVFAALGIWLGIRLTGRPERVVVREIEVPAPASAIPPASPATAPGAEFVRDAAQVEALRITPRELEILEQIAAGLSNREIAEKVFVSENTVKTHASRLFEKLGASRRTQAVQIAKQRGLIA